MKLHSPPILSTAIQAVQRRHTQNLEDLYAGKQPENVLALDGIWYGSSHGLSGVNTIDMLEAPEDWLADVLSDMRAQAELLADPLTFRPPVIELDAYGVHFMDALFGAPIRFHGGQVWSSELEGSFEDLACPELSRSVLFQKALRLAELAVESAREAAGEGGKVYIALPVFACAINVGINLFGERLLEGLHINPDGVRRALERINQAIQAATLAFYAVVPAELRRNSVAENRLAPAGVGQFDGCATQLISRRDYSRSFAPLDEGLMKLAPGGMLMHLCGAHTQHLPVWRGMAGLRAVQLNDRAMDDFAVYYGGLRPETLFYLSPSETMPVEKIMQISGGRRVILQTALRAVLPVLAAGD